MLLLAITPLLGSLKNFVKYKQYKPYIFIRTPIIYFLLHFFFHIQNVWKIIVLERWFMFLYKISASLYRNDYIKKKDKYFLKYGIKY